MSNKKQTVNGEVGNVVSGDVTIHNYSADILAATQQPISLLQKRDLHRLMDELVALGESKRELWLVLHTKLNTNTVNEMTAADYHCAVEILQECTKRIHHLKDSNLLISKIMSLTGSAYRLERDRYCLKHFGTTHLKGLDKEQLQRVFGYFDDLLNSGTEVNLQHHKANTDLQNTGFPQSSGKKNFGKIGAGVLIFFVAIAGVFGFSGKWFSASKLIQRELKVFSVDTNDNVINNAVPALRRVFPGLNKYSDVLLSVSAYKQKTGWHTLNFTVSVHALVPDSYGVRGKTCYINVHPEGNYARVLTAPCRSLLLDKAITPDNKYRFALR